MRLRVLNTLLLTTVVAITPRVSHAQDFGVTESAETVDRGNVKIKASPVVVFGKGAGNEVGVALAAGYGFTDRFDAEAMLAFYDGVTIVGGNGEFWLVKGGDLDISFSPGVHFRRGDNSNNDTGFDLTFIASGHASPKLEIYGAFDVALEKAGNSLPKSFNYTTLHLVPGLEYKMSEDVDLDAELGIALNDDSRHYVSAGVTFYFR